MSILTKTLFKISWVAAAFALPSTQAMAELPSDKYEQPAYAVVEQSGNIEIRDYAPMLIAEVELEGEREATINQGFRILAGYIFGGNVRRDSIAMTAPVVQQASEKIAMTSPVTQAPGENSGKWKIAFVMPKKYSLETLPLPNDKRITLRVTQAERRVAIRFSGFSTVNNLETHKSQLEEFVTKRGLKARSAPMLAFYDDPFTLPWNRRNEWWIALAQ